MPLIAYRLQPWEFVDRLVFDLCPSGFVIEPMARDASPQDRHQKLSEADFLMGSWVTTAVKLTEDDFQAGKQLKLVQLMSAGYEHVDLDLAARYGVPVAHFGDAMASVVAEHTLLLILAVLRRLLQLDAAVRSGAWRTGEPVLHELRGSRVGLIGLGYIGREVALRLRAFQAEVAYFSRHRLSAEAERSLGVEYLPFDELLARSDIVSLHVPLAPSTRGLIGERALGLDEVGRGAHQHQPRPGRRPGGAGGRAPVWSAGGRWSGRARSRTAGCRWAVTATAQRRLHAPHRRARPTKSGRASCGRVFRISSASPAASRRSISPARSTEAALRRCHELLECACPGRGSSVVEQRTHKPLVVSPILTPATHKS